MSKHKLVTLIALTTAVFLLLEGFRLLTNQGWSWIYAAAYGFALIFQLFALFDTQRSADR